VNTDSVLESPTVSNVNQTLKIRSERQQTIILCRSHGMREEVSEETMTGKTERNPGHHQ